MSYPINTGIPAENNDPADDQPLMQENFSNISSYLAIDHILAGATGNGFHKQVTYYTENTPAMPTDPTSVAFTAQGSSLSVAIGSATTVAQNFFRNQNAIFLLSAVRAFGVFTSSTSAVTTLLNAFNVLAISGSGTSYAITLATNAVVGNNVVVFTNTQSNTSTPAYTFSGGALRLTNVTIGTNVNFLILQI